MIELTLDQVRALAQAGSPPTVIDPTTQKTYALVPTDAGFPRRRHTGLGKRPPLPGSTWWCETTRGGSSCTSRAGT